jgi:hypothetical protein
VSHTKKVVLRNVTLARFRALYNTRSSVIYHRENRENDVATQTSSDCSTNHKEENEGLAALETPSHSVAADSHLDATATSISQSNDDPEKRSPKLLPYAC